jgi:hypothetical protein
MKQLLARIVAKLPPTEEINEIDDLMYVRDAWDSEVEAGRTLLSLDDGTSGNLTPEMKDLWQVLVFVDSAMHLLEAVLSDGLDSIFYNEMDGDIELLRKGLNSGAGALASLFEEACVLALSNEDIDPTSDAATGGPAEYPIIPIDDPISDRLAEIQVEMESILDESYERLIAMYKAGRLIP